MNAAPGAQALVPVTSPPDLQPWLHLGSRSCHRVRAAGRPGGRRGLGDAGPPGRGDRLRAIAVADYPGPRRRRCGPGRAGPGRRRHRLGTAVLNIGTWDPQAWPPRGDAGQQLSDGRCLLRGRRPTPTEWTAVGPALPVGPSRPGAWSGRRRHPVAARRRDRDGAGHRPRHPRGGGAAAPGHGPLLVGGKPASCATAPGWPTSWSSPGSVRRSRRATSTPRGIRRPRRRIAGSSPGPQRSGAGLGAPGAAGRRDRRPGRRPGLVPGRARRVAGRWRRLAALAETPYVLVGSEDEIVGRLRSQRDRWGLTRYTVRVDAVEPLAPVVRPPVATFRGPPTQ